MARIRGKVAEALKEAREWIEASKIEVRTREAALVEARQQLEMHETIYAVLEKTFMRQPAQRAAAKPSTKKSASGSGGKKRNIPDYSTTPCSKCGATGINAVHDKAAGYAGYHPFVAPSPVQPAPLPSSSSNGSPATQPVSSVTEMEGAGVVVHAASGGE